MRSRELFIVGALVESDQQDTAAEILESCGVMVAPLIRRTVRRKDPDGKKMGYLVQGIFSAGNDVEERGREIDDAFVDTVGKGDRERYTVEIFPLRKQRKHKITPQKGNFTIGY